MSISFEIPEKLLPQLQVLQFVAESIMRPKSRELDENEHARPTEFINTVWPELRDRQSRTLKKNTR